ncbi:putative membrane protein [Belliella buryatensis]|uniref:Putative membrane protein n=1 Tax=Belliella buryatensis TaxID=1500549 RepID=A0A239AJ18_9BACT|nr:DUF4142 domain-containing protein [Belliella buryatensis]SNR95657.1 putative membrane protein [Belliella buryatensis]
MKNLINYNTILMYSLCFVGPIFLTTACSENKANDSMKVAKTENTAKLTSRDTTILVIENDDDAKFLMKAAELQMERISLGKLAQQKGNTSHVKELGKTMETDYSKSHAELKTLALGKSVSIPNTLTDDSKKAYEKLNEKTGAEFEKAYSTMMVDDHKDAVKLFEKASTDSEDPKIRNWAS